MTKTIDISKGHELEILGMQARLSSKLKKKLNDIKI